ncbi:endolytic transglycosylase MltG [Silanimonas sp.]|uniref:endolytic transglycosylase MltG n=1 Tax=Silanimonas sp. TaxID=1929290 RepID=UPI001BC228F0|nr:endolytic transglycosylase MltG [Silanimonas sp.]MBS3895598.1 endolytic transglycosylase MltG [Silanimonas sp.]MBS3924319.1 endolytic transglycosylase MltG [Xanthomonadaceae bacterium]
MRRLLPRLLLATLLFGLLALLAAGLAWQRFETFRSSPAGAAEGAVLLVEPGDGFVSILSGLRELGVEAGHDLEWKLLAMRMAALPRLQAGEYALAPALSPEAILRKLVEGDVLRHRFTLVEGWSMRDLRAALASDPVLQDDLTGLDDDALMARLGRPGVPAEGRFLPETYLFVRGDGAIGLLRRAANAMDTALAETWEGRQPGLPLASPDELLTLASIIEKETGKAAERAEIAGVFVRRLRLGMRLQTDPTVIYGLGAAFDGNLRRRDLRTDTPFNTYTRAGLPPHAIAMPGRAALQAAAHPADGETLFFVSRGDGSHHFSRTYAEHRAAVRRYQLGER